MSAGDVGHCVTLASCLVSGGACEDALMPKMSGGPLGAVAQRQITSRYLR
jgi:hypothetical protein